MSLTDFAKHQVFRLLRTGFRLTPMPAASRDRLRQRFLDRYSALVPAGPRGQLSGANTSHRPLRHAATRAIGHVPYRRAELPNPSPATLVAFYLPQFHPIPENDAWWGKGFTEWHNVARALPQFEGHAQPRLPSDLGYYDLRQPNVMREQMRLARDYGIGAFCTYFYWFKGKTLLESPLEQWLADASLDLPICLCWANENWSRRWDGRAEDMLIAQEYSPEDDQAFIAHVSRYLRDPRYLRVEGKPVLLLYRPGLLPDAKATAQRWRDACRAQGIGEIHLAYVQSFDRVNPRDIGFDAAVEFPPNNTTLKPITATQRLINPDFQGDVLDWRELVAHARHAASPGYLLYPGVNPGWDNEPRRSGRGRVLAHASPRVYRDWLRHAIGVARQRSPDAPLVFVNAWNEWAEGAVLEPDVRLGHAWLEATRSALRAEGHVAVNRDTRPCVVIHAWYVEVLDTIFDALKASGIDWRIVITTAHERAHEVRARVATSGLTADVEAFENHGRDILPFLRIANRLLDEGVETVLKLHTKRSTHRDDGEAWRASLLKDLLSPGRARAVLEGFAQDGKLGLVAAAGQLPHVSEYWGANFEAFDYLITRLGLAAPDTDLRFPAGSMFWCRLEALRPLLDAHLSESDFETESGQIDGTLAHAIERVLGHVVASAGYRVGDSGPLNGDARGALDGSFHYAHRG